MNSRRKQLFLMLIFASAIVSTSMHGVNSTTVLKQCGKVVVYSGLVTVAANTALAGGHWWAGVFNLYQQNAPSYLGLMLAFVTPFVAMDQFIPDKRG